VAFWSVAIWYGVVAHCQWQFGGWQFGHFLLVGNMVFGNLVGGSLIGGNLVGGNLTMAIPRPPISGSGTSQLKDN